MLLALLLSSALAHDITVTNVNCQIQGSQIDCSGIQTTGPIPTPQPSPIPNMIPFDLASSFSVYSDRTFVPGCISGQDWGRTDCESQGNAKYGTIYSGQFTLKAKSKKIMSLLQAQAGENFGMFSGAISALSRVDLIGINPSCRFIESIQPYLTIADKDYVDSLGPIVTRPGYTYDPSAGICIVPSDKPIFLNITPSGPGSNNCGNRSVCRTQIIEGSPNFVRPSPTPSPTTGNTIIFTPSKSSNRTFIPGCIHGEDWTKTNCEYQDSMKKGRIYAAEIKVGANFSKSFKIDRAEAGENYTWTESVVSYSPGDLTPISKFCKWDAISNYPTFVDQAYVDANRNPRFDLFGSSCLVNSNSTVYINIFASGPDVDKCANTFICRVQLIEY